MGNNGKAINSDVRNLVMKLAREYGFYFVSMACIIFMVCTKKINGPGGKAVTDKHLFSSKSLLKTLDSTEVQIKYEGHESDRLSYSWSVNYGSIVSNGKKALFKAPSIPCTTTIRVQIIDNNLCFIDSIRILIYKQIIILKADDFQFKQKSLISQEWLNFISLVKNKNIKANLGLIGHYLDNIDSHSLKQLKELICDYRLELWNHGYSHVIDQTDNNGNHYWEFKNTSIEQQKQHILMTQGLAKKKLGIVLRTFGAPGNAIDENTQAALNLIDELKIWFFGSNESNKLVLGRFAEIEFPTHNPDYQRFLNNYDKTKEYLVLQIHPNSWDQNRLREFEKIIDFLLKEKSTFLTSIEYFEGIQQGKGGDSER
jgi:peptidoglycan/xylan/chitin deacetylase (PgdA/CDA1 family)